MNSFGRYKSSYIMLHIPLGMVMVIVTDRGNTRSNEGIVCSIFVCVCVCVCVCVRTVHTDMWVATCNARFI